MKSPIVSALPLAALSLLWPGYAQASTPAPSGIEASSHDLRGDGADSGLGGTGSAWGETRREICRACHMPHQQQPVAYGSDGIGWNQGTSTETHFQMYGSDPAMLSWLDGAIEPAPTGSSKLCLGCHDGVSAVNQYDGRGGIPSPTDHTSGAGVVGMVSSAAIGATSASLTNNHPISITYAWGRDAQLHDPTSALLGAGRSVQSLLENGRVECATCHDVHNSEVGANTAMLRVGVTGEDISGAGASALCLVCHDK